MVTTCQEHGSAGSECDAQGGHSAQGQQGCKRPSWSLMLPWT